MTITQYLQQHHSVPVNVGKSGAEVLYLDNGTTAKHVRRDAVSQELWDSCIREAQFYRSTTDRRLPYLPEISHLEITDHEILVIMRRYTPLTANQLTPQILRRILSALASLQRETPPAFLLSDNRTQTLHINAQTAATCAEGWSSVLAEHGLEFSANSAFPAHVAKLFNRINEHHTPKNPVLCHGDFHIGNILLDNADTPVFCDFQSCSIGDGCGDLSFFLSRLSADGIQVDHDHIINIYSEQSGLSVYEIKNRMALSNFNTSFLFWHEYLHGSNAARVHTIFDAMKSDFEQLTAE